MAMTPVETAIARLAISRICRTHPFPRDQAEKMLCPVELYEKLEAKWKALATNKGDDAIEVLFAGKTDTGDPLFEIRHRLFVNQLRTITEMYVAFKMVESDPQTQAAMPVFGLYCLPPKKDNPNDHGSTVCFLDMPPGNLDANNRHDLESIWTPLVNVIRPSQYGKDAKPWKRGE